MANVDGNTLTLEPGEVADIIGDQRLDAPATAPAAAIEPDQLQTRPTQPEVIDAIKAEMKAQGRMCGTIQAQEFDRWIGRVVSYAREKGGQNVRYKMTQREWDRFHRVLVRVMPDDRTSRPGTVHDLLERRHLRFTDGEISIMHTNIHGACVIIVSIGSVEVVLHPN